MAIAPSIQASSISNWAKGINSVSYDYTDIASDEVYYARNVQITREGHVKRKNGCPVSADFPDPPSANAVANLFWSDALQLMILQVGTTLYKCARGGGSWTSFRTCSTSKRCEFVDFSDRIVYVHPDDGVRTYTGAADASASTVVKGQSIAVWQNKVWVGSDTSDTLWWSNAGDAATWTTAVDTNKIRDKDTKPIKALFPSSGLLVFKEDSFYRINDSTTGSYQTIDYNNGALCHRAVTGSQNNIYFMGLTTIYQTSGLSPARDMASNIAGSWLPYMTSTVRDRVCALQVADRVYFTVTSLSSTSPDTILELFSPSGGWMVHTIAKVSGLAEIGGLTKYTNSNGTKTPLLLNVTNPKLNELLTASTGSSQGTDVIPFSSQFYTGFIVPNHYREVRLLRVRFLLQNVGSSLFTFQFGIVTDASDSIYAQQWSATSTTKGQGLQIRPNVICRAFRLQIDETIGQTNSHWRLRGIEFDFIPIEEP